MGASSLVLACVGASSLVLASAQHLLKRVRNLKAIIAPRSTSAPPVTNRVAGTAPRAAASRRRGNAPLVSLVIKRHALKRHRAISPKHLRVHTQKKSNALTAHLHLLSHSPFIQEANRTVGCDLSPTDFCTCCLCAMIACIVCVSVCVLALSCEISCSDAYAVACGARQQVQGETHSTSRALWT